MFAYFGNLFLQIGLSSIFISIFSEMFFRRLKLTNLAILISQISILFSFFTLIIIFIENDLRNVTVLLNSSSIMELKYRIAAAWSSHETSVLFWCAVLSVVNIIYLIQSSFEKKTTYLISIFLQSILLASIYFSGNPFIKISTMPDEGLGMNPSLQDFAMMIHPPILYFAYSGYHLIFSMLIADEIFSEQDIKYKKIWSRISLSLLTLAIGLGGWWAYRELGWGGYWYFDPVENISLLVWIFGICYHHTSIQKGFDTSKLLLGLSPLIAIFLGTFFVRSGILISVHSFATAKSILWFAAIFILVFVISLIAIFKNLYRKKITYKNSLKEKLINTNNYIWMISAFIIIITLLYPTIIFYLFNDKVEVEADFYISTLVPVMLFSSFLAVFSNKFGKLNIFLCAFLLPVFPISISEDSGIIMAIGYYVSSCIIMISIIDILKLTITRKFNISNVSMLTSHLGLALMIFSICFNNHYGFKKEINIEIGESKSYDEYQISLEGMSYGNGKNYIKQVAEIHITKDNEIVELSPELRFYPVEKSLSSQADLVNYLFHDWYAVIGNAEDEKINITIMYHPAISFIWFSIFLMSMGIMLKLVRKF